MIENLALAIMLVIIYILLKCIRSLFMYIVEARLDMSNKGLVFIPIYSNYVEGEIVENTLAKILGIEGEKLITYKALLVTTPIFIIAYIIGTWTPNKTELAILDIVMISYFLFIYIIRTATRIWLINKLKGNIVLNVILNILAPDFWCIYLYSLINSTIVYNQTLTIKKQNNLNKIGLNVEWH